MARTPEGHLCTTLSLSLYVSVSLSLSLVVEFFFGLRALGKMLVRTPAMRFTAGMCHKTFLGADAGEHNEQQASAENLG